MGFLLGKSGRQLCGTWFWFWFWVSSSSTSRGRRRRCCPTCSVPLVLSNLSPVGAAAGVLGHTAQSESSKQDRHGSGTQLDQHKVLLSCCSLGGLVSLQGHWVDGQNLGLDDRTSV